jgi:predicted flap endonuclease-1-like 5' DNA nuclease
MASTYADGEIPVRRLNRRIPGVGSCALHLQFLIRRHAMASFLFLVAGLVVGFLGGWLLRGLQSRGRHAATGPIEARPAASGTAVPEPVAAAEPAVEASAEPEPVETASVETASVETAPVEAAPVQAAPVQAAPVKAAPVETVEESLPATATADPGPIDVPPAAEPVSTKITEPAAADVDEPAVADEPIAEPPVVTPAAEPAVVAAQVADPVLEPSRSSPDTAVATAVIAEPVAGPITDAVPAQRAATAKPDNLTRIPGVGPKMALALKAAGITTFEALAASDETAIRAAITAAGLRFAPSATTWPQQAKLLADGGR